MKLTRALRKAFVRDVMNSVPTIDYHKQMADIVTAEAVKNLPDKIKAIWNDKALRHYIRTEYTYITPIGRNVLLPTGGKPPFNDKLGKELTALAQAMDAQNVAHRVVADRLETIAASCTTTKKLAELVPDLVEHTPKDERQACTNLPALNDIMPALKKLGFPKGKGK